MSSFNFHMRYFGASEDSGSYLNHLWGDANQHVQNYSGTWPKSYKPENLYTSSPTVGAMTEVFLLWPILYNDDFPELYSQNAIYTFSDDLSEGDHYLYDYRIGPDGFSLVYPFDYNFGNFYTDASKNYIFTHQSHSSTQSEALFDNQTWGQPAGGSGGTGWSVDNINDFASEVTTFLAWTILWSGS